MSRMVRSKSRARKFTFTKTADERMGRDTTPKEEMRGDEQKEEATCGTQGAPPQIFFKVLTHPFGQIIDPASPSRSGDHRFPLHHLDLEIIDSRFTI